MAPDTQQAVVLYEQGMPVEEVASQLSVGVDEVKLVLASHSLVYHEANKRSNRETFSDAEAAVAKQVMTGLLIDDSNSHIKYRAARYILDEKNGKKNKATVGTLNLTLINNQMKRAQKAIAAAKGVTVDI